MLAGRTEQSVEVALQEVLLHCGKPEHGEAATPARDQMAAASSSNATANRRLVGSPVASS
jgi:hypothetical protein